MANAGQARAQKAQAFDDIEAGQSAALQGLLEMHRRGDYAAMCAASSDYVSAAKTAARAWMLACRNSNFHAPCGARRCAHDTCIADVTAICALLTDTEKISKNVDKHIGGTAFLCACAAGAFDVASYLAESGTISLYQCNAVGDTVLHRACHYGKLQAVKYMVSVHAFADTLRNNAGLYARQVARVRGHTGIADYLCGIFAPLVPPVRGSAVARDLCVLRAPATMDAVCALAAQARGWATLDAFARECHVQAVALGVLVGQYMRGELAHMRAAEAAVRGVARLAAARALQYEFYTPLCAEYECTHATCTEHAVGVAVVYFKSLWLLTVDTVSETPHSPESCVWMALATACARNSEDFAWYLLGTKRVNTQMVDARGRTLLHHACTGGNPDLVQEFVERYHVPHAPRDATGLRAFDLAYDLECKDVADYIASLDAPAGDDAPGSALIATPTSAPSTAPSAAGAAPVSEPAPATMEQLSNGPAFAALVAAISEASATAHSATPAATLVKDPSFIESVAKAVADALVRVTKIPAPAPADASAAAASPCECTPERAQAANNSSVGPKCRSTIDTPCFAPLLQLYLDGDFDKLRAVDAPTLQEAAGHAVEMLANGLDIDPVNAAEGSETMRASRYSMSLVVNLAHHAHGRWLQGDYGADALDAVRHACTHGWSTAARQLISSGAVRADHVFSDGSTLLHVACATGCLDMVRYLCLMHGASPHVRNSAGLTPRKLARRLGHDDAVRFFDSPGMTADPGNEPVPDDAVLNALMRTILDSNITLFRATASCAFMQAGKAALRLCIGKRMYVPPCGLITCPHDECVRMSAVCVNVAHYAHSNLMSVKWADSEVEYVQLAAGAACARGWMTVSMHLLRSALVKTDYVYPDGGTLLHKACSGGSLPLVVRLLHDCGLRDDVSNKLGMLARDVALQSGYAAIVAYLDAERDSERPPATAAAGTAKACKPWRHQVTDQVAIASQ